MTNDVADLVGRTHREIGGFAGSGTRSVLLRRGYDSAIEDVWAACTEPDRLNRWFLPVSGDLRVGGKYSLTGNASGEILDCAAPSQLRVTWEYAGHVSEVELRLSETAGQTVLEIEHSGLDDGMDIGGLIGVGVGWDPGLWTLEKYLHGELPDAPAADWQGGPPPPEVLAFMERVAAVWMELAGGA